MPLTYGGEMSFRNAFLIILLLVTLPLLASDILLRIYDSGGEPIDSVFVRGEVRDIRGLRASVPDAYSGPEYRTGVFFADSPETELFTLLEPMDVADYADQAGWAHIAATALNVPSGDTANFAWFADSARIAGNAYIAIWADSAGYTVFSDSASIALFADSAYHAIFSDTAEFARNAIIPDTVDFAIWADSANWSHWSDSSIIADTALFAFFADTAEYARNAVVPDSVLYADSASWADTAGYSFASAFAESSLTALLAEYAVNAESSVYADTAEYARNMDLPDTVNFAIWADSANWAHRADSAIFADTADFARNSDTCTFEKYIVVAPSCGDYDNLADAFAAVPPGEEQWVIKVMPGNYTISSPLTLPTLVTLKGDGPDVVSIFLGGSLTMGSFAAIRDIQFNGGSITTSGANMLQNCIMDTTELIVGGSQPNALDRVIFRGDASHTAISINASANVNLFGCAFTDCGDGISAATGGAVFRAVNCMFYSVTRAFALNGAGAVGYMENCLSSASGYNLGLSSFLNIDSPTNSSFGIPSAMNVIFLDQARYTGYTTSGGDWSWTAPAPTQVDAALDYLSEQVPAPGRSVQAQSFTASQRMNLPIYDGANPTPTGLSFAPTNGDMIIWNDTSSGNDFKICIRVDGAWECADVN